MLGSAHLHYDPVFVDHVTQYLSEQEQQHSGLRSRRTEDTEDHCELADIDLNDFPQWQKERGYWIGEYTFLGGDGQPFVSSSWNYKYGAYKGFITGEVVQ